jgi:hypothetical protein
MAVGWQLLIVAAIAAFVGLAELVGRYKSDPVFALKSSPAAWTYIGVNAGAGMAALGLIHAFDWTFGQTDNVELIQMLVAGFSAIAFFRSSFFNARIGGADVPIGPSLVLGSILDACDREVDRRSAVKMADVASDDAVKDFNPTSVVSALPVLCLALMQNFPVGAQAQLSAEIKRVSTDKELAPDAQMRAVIITLARHLGPDVVAKVLAGGAALFRQPPPSATGAPRVSETEEVLEQTKDLLNPPGERRRLPDERREPDGPD